MHPAAAQPTTVCVGPPRPARLCPVPTLHLVLHWSSSRQTSLSVGVVVQRSLFNHGRLIRSCCISSGAVQAFIMLRPFLFSCIAAGAVQALSLLRCSSVCNLHWSRQRGNCFMQLQLCPLTLWLKPVLTLRRPQSRSYTGLGGVSCFRKQGKQPLCRLFGEQPYACC